MKAMILNGTVEVYACCDTLQVADCSRYDMGCFNKGNKKQMREKQFPQDLEKAFEMGARLSGGKQCVQGGNGRFLRTGLQQMRTGPDQA